MGGKKKKSVANKLAKMSDEERARYMQHRAEIEEEAKRRKEQLIATFMKKKVKKEEAFSRLNIAKINQNWHQMLRKSKCQEMKENIEHMKNWIERVVNYKNKTIARLVKELDEAEDDYLNNFASHSNHIDNILDKQTEYIDKLNNQYQDDLNDLLRCAEKEKSTILENAEEEQMYLKTILYRQGMNEKIVKKETDQYMQKFYEDQHTLQSKINKMRKSREEVCTAIWKNIETTVRKYVESTDKRRLHLAELKRLDIDTAAEIAQNRERLEQEQVIKTNLKEELERTRAIQDLHLKSLNHELEDLQKVFNKLRKNLHHDLQIDERKLKLLVNSSSETKSHLENLVKKGQDMLFLIETSKKFETGREKLIKWYTSTRNNVLDSDQTPDEEFHKEQEELSEELADDKKQQYLIVSDLIDPELQTEGLSVEKVELTSILSPCETNITTVQNITLQDKPPEDIIPPLSVTPEQEEPTGFVDQCLKKLEPLENFWTSYNQVKVDCMDILQEKKYLEMENKQLRGMIRAVLEASALANSIPSSKVPTRFPSRRLSVASAPFRRLLFD